MMLDDKEADMLQKLGLVTKIHEKGLAIKYFT